MKRLAWITDIHLNFVQPSRVESFLQSLSETAVDAVLLSGDIGEANDVVLHLANLTNRLDCPIYFVLGNHDFYRGTMAGVRQKVRALCSACPTLVWLPDAGVVPLSDRSALVGHDGWGDGRLGDYYGSPVVLNDWRFIGDFIDLDAAQRLRRLKALGDEAAASLAILLPSALQQFSNIVVLTHVPPFREACWHEGRISNDYWLPHFTCKALGDVLAKAMAAHPDRQMTVLCGHTHGAGEAWILPNLRVLTGGAVYGQPVIQQVLEVE